RVAVNGSKFSNDQDHKIKPVSIEIIYPTKSMRRNSCALIIQEIKTEPGIMQLNCIHRIGHSLGTGDIWNRIRWPNPEKGIRINRADRLALYICRTRIYQLKS